MKKIFSLILAIVMVLSVSPVISADELGQGSLEVSGSIVSGKGSILIKLKPPVDSITVSGVEMDVILPSKFSFDGNVSASISGWDITSGSTYTAEGCKARKITAYTTKKAFTTKKDSLVTLVKIPVTYPVNMVPGNKTVTIKLSDVAIDFGGKTVSGLDYFEADTEGGTKEFTYVKSFKYEKSITSAKITGIVSKYYTGGRIKQSPKLVVDGNVLEEGSDYGITYSENTKCGVANMTIHGKGGYKGQIKKTFYILPASITDVSTSDSTSYSAKIKWSPAKTVDGYFILRSTSKTGKYSTIKTITDPDVTSYLDKTLLSGRYYYYKVQAYKTIKGKKEPGKLTTAAPAIRTAGYTINKLTGLKVSRRTSTSVTLKWNKTLVENDVANRLVSGYYIYRSTSSDSGFKKIATIEDGNTVTYKNKGLSAGKTYYYRVQPYKTYKGENGKGQYATVTAKTLGKLGTVSGLKKASVTVGSISLKWGSVSTASGYQIYRSSKKSSGYSLVATVTKAKYTHKGLLSGTSGYYKVRAYRNEDGKKVYGKYSSVISAKTAGYKVGTPTGLKTAAKSSGKISIKWKKVTNANGYFVYRSTSKTSGYKKISTLTSGKKVTYTDKKVGSKKTYYYKVVAYRTYKKSKGIGKSALLKVSR